MKYKFLLHYTEALVRQAVFRFWWRTVGPGFLVALAILSGGLGYMLFTNHPAWKVGALGAVLIFSLGFVALIYWVHYQNSMRKFRAMVSPVASFEISEVGFSFTSDVATSNFKWTAISEVLIFENMWIFLFSKSQFSTIPLEDIPEEARNHIVSRIKFSGGKIG